MAANHTHPKVGIAFTDFTHGCDLGACHIPEKNKKHTSFWQAYQSWQHQQVNAKLHSQVTLLRELHT